MTQKISMFLWQAVKKATLRGTDISFRKYGTTDSLEGRTAGENIIYKPVTGTVKYKDMIMKLKPVRKSDIWMQEALTHRVKYCRIVRRVYGKHYKYFLQLVLEGNAPDKLIKGKGTTGLDPGVSTMSTCNDTGCRFDILSPEYDKYDREVRKWAITHERRRRLANPQNYNPDGTIKKDTKTFKKHWVHTKREREALMHLKSAYRLRTEYVKQSNNYKTNRIIEDCDTLIKEPMDYPALARHAKETSRRDKAEAVKKKDGTVQMVHKYKRKKRFGKSILAHAPGQYIKRLEEKCKKYGVNVIDVNTQTCKASQLNHVTGGHKKPLLSERTKVVGGYTVQRDLYSAFLMRHALPDGNSIDPKTCKRDFPAFLKLQEDAVWEYLLNGYTSRNFGMTLADIKVPA